MNKFISFLAPTIEEFILFRKLSKNWNTRYENGIAEFDKHCFYSSSKATELSQEMVDTWCMKRDSEKNSSWGKRLYPVSHLINYMRGSGLTNVSPLEFPRWEARTYIPHAFTEEEIRKFFDACDNLESSCNNLQNRLRRITVPVFFRLLYSSGIRTTEARLLRVNNVDLQNGILDIQYSKGYAQHYVALHDSMILLLRKYDEAVSKICPGREFFFPSPTGTAHSAQWASINFHKIWKRVSTSHAVPYALRHHYAITNINSWIGEGFKFDDKLLYLSKSMGHANVEITKYYYSLVPGLSDIIEKQTNPGFEEIVPEVIYEEIQQ